MGFRGAAKSRLSDKGGDRRLLGVGEKERRRKERGVREKKYESEGLGDRSIMGERRKGISGESETCSKVRKGDKTNPGNNPNNATDNERRKD